jgi:hypothetical protein
MRYTVIALALFFVACASASQMDETPSLEVLTPAGTTGEIRQQIYEVWLETTRGIVADDDGLACQSEYRDILAQTVIESGQDSVLFELAFLDACKEAGAFTDIARFSQYYVNAPPH